MTQIQEICAEEGKVRVHRQSIMQESDGAGRIEIDVAEKPVSSPSVICLRPIVISAQHA